ncbi:uncharacterized protein LOC126904996 [Daktulosphaira vitifoliae]|uniref:uncharacterized protein LOC126904996 n=1 Tax=Daktulosphaira vitifoliae TaxID=58002 RepID=UPI0021AA2F0A|nr:uncharacterized protein LOC126904996 [Daktulosphaira vitifoliae]
MGSNKKLSIEERSCIEHFEQTVKREPTGKFIVELPLKNNVELLGDSKAMARRRFLATKNNLRKNNDLRVKYVEFMDEYLKLNHMEESQSTNEISYYMPHHAVLRNHSATTQTRVVFDASAQSTSGTSLNQILMKGPVIQDELICILARFRVHKYVLSADIAKMYRQIWVAKKDRVLQKIFWRSQPHEELKEYCLSTVTYGTTSAPYIATACLKKLADENCTKYPSASKAISTDFYVDDYLGGANTIEEAITLRDQIIKITDSAGFTLRKWISNEPSLLSTIKNISNDPHYVMNIDGSAIKTLGLLWSPWDDYYQYKYNDIESSKQSSSKRTILSTIATIFDPLGLIGPVVVSAKKIMQQLWQLKTDWDDELPAHISREWEAYRNELVDIEKIKIPRRIIGCNNVCDMQIHAFADASISAYGSCIYLMAKDADGSRIVRLIASKSRVAPLKVISLARLELCTAVLSVRLVNKLIPKLNCCTSKIWYWSDSQIVLAWINSPSSRWKTFVSHRVGEIHNTSTAAQWKHVRSTDNPADIISRGCSPKALIENKLWWTGPTWLTHDESNWPNNNCQKIIVVKDDLEKKQFVVTLTKIEKFDITERFSSLTKLLNITAYILRWRKIVRNKRSSNSKCIYTIYIDPEETNRARQKLLLVVQSQYFSEELQCLHKGESIKKKSKLFFLSPFVDNNGLIRVGGRLNNSASISNDRKNPILLPSKSAFTMLLFKYEHIRLLHSGPQALLAAVREQYWPINGRNIARYTVHKCIPCFKSKPMVFQPIMGNLPSSRVDAFERAFFAAGVDYAGPINIKSGLRKNAPLVKAYVSLFVCFSSKAVHLELVSDLTTESFLNALRRFWARRGMNKYMYSDNATNMVGANRKLKELIELFKSKDHLEAVNRCSAALGVKWCFIPARSPHFGGLWESSVKSVKKHLTRSFGEASLSYEELYTALVRIEACLNSRPITPLSTDPSDLNALTPAHFLIGGSLTEIPEPDLTKITPNRLRRWQRVTQLTQQVWNRWQTEYLSTLQYRAKWTKSVGAVPKEGDLVLIKECNLPPLQWRLGRISKIFFGNDNIPRVAMVKTDRGEFKRAVRTLCPLPLDEE